MPRDKKEREEGLVEELMEGRPHGPPFVSPRSPSYERSRRARGKPPEPEAVAVGAILDILEAEAAHALIAEDAGSKVEEETFREILYASADKAWGRAQELRSLIKRLGGSPLDDDEVDKTVMPLNVDDLVRVGTEAELFERLAEQTDRIIDAYRTALERPFLPGTAQDELSSLYAMVE